MSQALFVIIFIIFNSLARPNVSKLPLVTGSLMEENSIYNAEGGFLFLSFNGFFEGWRGFEPQSHSNETQVINSLSLWHQYSDGWLIHR